MPTNTSIEASMRHSPGKSDVFTREEVAKHNTPESSWIIVGNYVYDITKFADMHVCFSFFFFIIDLII